MTLKRGIVVATHPEDHSVDVLMADGRRLVGVQVLTPNGSARSGTFDMPAVPSKSGDKWDIRQPHGQDQIAIVGFMDGHPLVVGFMYPQSSQMTFKDPKRSLSRHQSDVYWTVDGSGNAELHHPSGAFVRVAATPDHEDLSKKNADASMALDRNTGGPGVNIRIQVGQNFINLSPDGVLAVKAKTISLYAEGEIMMKASNIKIDSPTTRSSGDIVSGSVSLNAHRHTGVKAGGDNSGPPSGTGGLFSGETPPAQSGGPVGGGGSGGGGNSGSAGSASTEPSVPAIDPQHPPTVATNSIGARVVTFPNGQQFVTDPYGNRQYVLPGAKNYHTGGPVRYIEAGTTLFYVAPDGSVLPSILIDYDELEPNPVGILFGKQRSFVQVVPEGDPLPGNTDKVFYPPEVPVDPGTPTGGV